MALTRFRRNSRSAAFSLKSHRGLVRFPRIDTTSATEIRWPTRFVALACRGRLPPPGLRRQSGAPGAESSSETSTDLYAGSLLRSATCPIGTSTLPSGKYTATHRRGMA